MGQAERLIARPVFFVRRLLAIRLAVKRSPERMLVAQVN
jgi:hypothetical protein